jgi:tetratricopeptide (TPR) repeat protein
MKQKTSFHKIFFSLFTLLSLSFSAIAQERGSELIMDTVKSTGTSYALIVGISNYNSITDLKYADKDAVGFENFLMGSTGGSIPASNIFSFINEEATRINIADALSNIASRVKPGDRFYFFFAGHGDMEVKAQKENGLLLLYNAPNGGYFGIIDDVLEIAQLRDYLSPLSQKGVEIMYIIDACHSGKLSGGNEGVKQTAAAMLATWGREYKILSCQPNQFSLEGEQWGGGRGLFSLKLEEAMKGGADANKDGQITMLELYVYTLTNVSKASKDRQIPLMSGDLSKEVLQVPVASATAKPLPTNGVKRHTSMDTLSLINKLDPTAKAMYEEFKNKIAATRLIYPWDTNALKDYRAFCKAYPGSELAPFMKRKLIEVLPRRFNDIVTPLLKGDKSYSSKDECYYAGLELDSCLGLLGKEHYLYPNIKARKLYMESMALTWALSESEYNSGWTSTVEKSIKLLEQSYDLEPNAAYTALALGERYYFVAQFDKAEKNFSNYLELRPKDMYARYSLAVLYNKIGRYENAEMLFREISKIYPKESFYYWLIADALISQEKYDAARNELGKMLQLHDTSGYYFYTGIFYAKQDLNDSAIYYYKKSKSMLAQCDYCDNNIGHMYLVTMRLDSATAYFKLASEKDPKSPFPNFNLGTIETLRNNYVEAIDRFITCIDNCTESQECIVTHMDIYFNKAYTVANEDSRKTFSRHVYIYKIQYMGYLSILYAYLRDNDLKKKTDKIDLIFSYLFKFKEYDNITWYHYACWKSLGKDRAAALESLEKALNLGFGSYFQISADDDLDYIRDTAKYKELMKKYFPEETK